jgi:hypothetical protein
VAMPGENSFLTHSCQGHPKLIFARRGTVLATVSFDHARFLRPYTKTLWSRGDMQLTDASARAMAKWFDRNGLRLYQQEIDREDGERARQDAFRAELPPGVRGCLRPPPHEAGMFDIKDLEPPPECRELFASEVPDPVERAHAIFRALGQLDGEWNSWGRAEAVVLDGANGIGADSLVAAIKGIGKDPIEIRGAARVLFGSREGGGQRIKELEPKVAEDLAVRLAPGIFAEGDSHNSRSLPLKLARFWSAAVNRVLLDAAGRADESEDRPCSKSLVNEANASLSALVVLAERRLANPAVIRAAAARDWRCPTNRASARVAAALAEGALPTAQDLKDSDVTAALMTLRRLKGKPTRQAEQLAREALFCHPWGVVSESTERWLAHLTRTQLDARQGRAQPSPRSVTVLCR